MATREQIAVIGLGYVGLPLAVNLARRFRVTGYDIKRERVGELRSGYDCSGEVTAAALRSASGLQLTTTAEDLVGSTVFIITVPTPVDPHNRPDLAAVISACQTVGRTLAKGAVVVLESTVYPGVTEEICGPELERISGLRCGVDFFLGYSPERMNPGDREHTVDRIVKVVAGQTKEVAEKLAAIYGAINNGQIFVARSIKTAEAAKVIENAQRDINIAFINEVTMIFNRLGLSIYDVLDAASTKWNFLRFTPGLVGGHCIGVDPFYLADVAQRLGHDPAVVLAGRRINDHMGSYIGTQICRELKKAGARVLVLGLTFKEDVSDLRNSKVVDVVRTIAAHGHAVDIHDPLANRDEARHEYGLDLLSNLEGAKSYDCVVGAVGHKPYRQLDGTQLAAMLTPGGLVADIKGMWRKVALPAGFGRWQP